MRNLARKQQLDPAVSETYGTVIRSDGPLFVIETETRELRAKRATSCLLEPAPGDLVLIAETDFAEQAYVLAVLEREAGAPATLVADGDLEIKLAGGSFGVAARETVRLTASKAVSVVSAAVHVNAIDGSVALERFSFLSKFVRAELGKAKVVAETLDSVLDRVSQRVKRSYRIIEESDHVRAEQIDYAARKRLSLHGENALVTAQHLAKIEGDQIHLG